MLGRCRSIRCGGGALCDHCKERSLEPFVEGVLSPLLSNKAVLVSNMSDVYLQCVATRIADFGHYHLNKTIAVLVPHVVDATALFAVFLGCDEPPWKHSIVVVPGLQAKTIEFRREEKFFRVIIACLDESHQCLNMDESGHVGLHADVLLLWNMYGVYLKLLEKHRGEIPRWPFGIIEKPPEALP